MKKNKVSVDDAYIKSWTERNKSRIKDHLKKAEKLTLDEHKEFRQKEQLCKCCHYLDRGKIVMQAFHTQECGICDQDQIYPNSDTHLLCKNCATERGVCKRCASKMD